MTLDVPFMVKFSYSYDLPFGLGKAFGENMPRLLDAIIGGWKTNGIWDIHSGRPPAVLCFEWRNAAAHLWPSAAQFRRHPEAQSLQRHLLG